jgi:mycothiol synthase
VRTPPPLEIGPLVPAVQDAVRALAARAEEADGVAPLSEQPLLRLDADEPWLTHAVARSRSGEVIGYLQDDRSGEVASAELVVDPEHRRGGVGRLLLRTAERDARLPMFSGTPGQRGKDLRVWAHGDLPAARALAAAAGYAVVRELLLLARRLPAVDGTGGALDRLPAGYEARAFRPGHDDEAWVTLNARAFAAHPEQGRLTVADLRQRQAEAWFDAAGFFLVWAPDGSPAGYVWTKVEPDQPGAARDGEIYAVGVDPDHQGRGLGGALTAVGLAHLTSVGCARGVLYVDGDNAPALATYARAGFERAAVDVQYGRV